MEWISVTDKTPDVGERVLVVHAAFGVQIAWRINNGVEKWIFYTHESEDKSVTHWMPLPKPPKT